jgi:hypothetical protein
MTQRATLTSPSSECGSLPHVRDRMLLAKRNHAYAESVEAMVGDLFGTCSSETHKDAQLAITRSMRDT